MPAFYRKHLLRLGLRSASAAPSSPATALPGTAVVVLGGNVVRGDALAPDVQRADKGLPGLPEAKLAGVGQFGDAEAVHLLGTGAGTGVGQDLDLLDGPRPLVHAQHKIRMAGVLAHLAERLPRRVAGVRHGGDAGERGGADVFAVERKQMPGGEVYLPSVERPVPLHFVGLRMRLPGGAAEEVPDGRLPEPRVEEPNRGKLPVAVVKHWPALPRRPCSPPRWRGLCCTPRSASL